MGSELLNRQPEKTMTEQPLITDEMIEKSSYMPAIVALIGDRLFPRKHKKAVDQLIALQISEHRAQYAKHGVIGELSAENVRRMAVKLTSRLDAYQEAFSGQRTLSTAEAFVFIHGNFAKQWGPV